MNRRLVRWPLFATIFTGMCALTGACSVQSSPDEQGSYATDSCAQAQLDDYGYCRASNGQFARTACCTPTNACETATLDASGICRRADNGQFAPVTCCEQLCGGAQLDEYGYCRAADGRFALSACCADQCVGPDQPAACHPNTDSQSIADSVDFLMEMYDYGRHKSEAVDPAEPLDMIKQYLEQYLDDDSVFSEYQFVENATEFYVDEMIAGTIRFDAVLDEAMYGLEDWVGWGLGWDEGELAQNKDRVSRALQSLAKAGAVFGFDGFEQNGCAAPTSYLLVIDRATGVVYGIDLSPCSES